MAPSPLEETGALEMEEVEEEEVEEEEEEEEVEYVEVSEYEEVTEDEDEELEPQPKEQRRPQNPIFDFNFKEDAEEEEEEEEIEYEEVSEYEDEEESEHQPKEEPQPKQESQPQSPNPSNDPNLRVPEPIAQLQSLYTAITSFLHQYSSFCRTLDSINASIPKSATLNIDLTDLKLICQFSASKHLRKYIYDHLSDLHHLRQEVPEALKLSPNPANLILQSMTKFYLQGRKAYEHEGLPEIKIRQISILLLEFYMIAGCPVAERSEWMKIVRDSAKAMAAVWRDRMVKEGGVEVACAEDALGLMLLVGGFGVPQEFTMMDLYHLLKLSNLKKKGDVLRRSRILVEKMPDIVKDLTAKEMHVEAVDLIYAFGLEEKFPPVPLLSSFVEKTCEGGSEERREGQCSTRSLKQATEKQLAALRSVLKCLEDHNIDASELSSLGIIQEIATCDKERLNFEQKSREANAKRKLEDVGQPKSQYNQAKQLRSLSAEEQAVMTDANNLETAQSSSAGKTVSGKLACFTCGSSEHLARDCHVPKRCFKCGSLGHFKSQCSR